MKKDISAAKSAFYNGKIKQHQLLRHLALQVRAHHFSHPTTMCLDLHPNKPPPHVTCLASGKIIILSTEDQRRERRGCILRQTALFIKWHYWHWPLNPSQLLLSLWVLTSYSKMNIFFPTFISSWNSSLPFLSECIKRVVFKEVSQKWPPWFRSV